MNKKNSKAQAAGQQATAAAANTANPATLKKPSLSKEDLISYGALAVVILLVILIRSKFVNIPFERDEGAYSLNGRSLLEGKIPYKDFYEQKFPGVFYFYAFMVSVFGATVKGMHIGFIFLNIASLLLLFFAARKLFSPFAGLITATTFAIVSITPTLSGFTIQSEHGVAFFSCLGIFLYAVAREKQRWYWYLIMGLAFGAAFMVKTTGLFMMGWGGIILLTDFFFSKERVFKDLVIRVTWYGIGAFFVIGILFLIIYMKGAFKDMIYFVYDIPKYYVNRISREEGMKYFEYSRDAVVANYKFLWIHGMLALALCFIKSIDWKTRFFVFTLAFMSFLTIVPGYYFYGHYWIQTLPGLAMLSGITYYCFTLLLKDRFKVTSPGLKYIYLGVFAVFVCMHLSKQKSYYFHPNYDLILRQVYGNNPFPETMQIANYLNQIAKPEDQVAVFGSEPQLYIYMNKKCPTRHIFFSTLVASIPEHKQFQREFVAEIEKEKPKYFVFYRHAVSLLVQANTDQYVFEWANKYLTENYKVIGVVDMPDGQLNSTNVFGKESETYQPKGQNVIYIFEKKT